MFDVHWVSKHRVQGSKDSGSSVRAKGPRVQGFIIGYWTLSVGCSAFMEFIGFKERILAQRVNHWKLNVERWMLSVHVQSYPGDSRGRGIKDSRAKWARVKWAVGDF